MSESLRGWEDQKESIKWRLKEDKYLLNVYCDLLNSDGLNKCNLRFGSSLILLQPSLYLKS